MLYEAVNPAVLRIITATRGRLLDLGCGTGTLGAAIKREAEREVVGVTFSREEAEIAAGRLDRCLVEDLEYYVPQADLGKFGVIVCSHILEHLRDPGTVLRNLRRSLQPTGLLIIALPNVLHWKQRLQFVRGQFRYTDGGIMDRTHLRFFDWETAQVLVRESGYELQAITGDGNCPLPIVRRLLRDGMSAVLDRGVCAAWPGLFAAQFVLECRLANRDETR